MSKRFAIWCLGVLILAAAVPVFAQPVDPVMVVDPVVVVEEKGILDYVISAAYAALLSMATIAAGYIAAMARKLAMKAGINVTEAQQEKFQGFVERSIKWAAEFLKIRLTGKNTAEEKDQIATLAATKYIPEQAADTVRKMGGDPNDAVAMKAVVLARGADVLNSPAPGVLEVAKADALLAGGKPVIPAPSPVR